MTLAGCSIDSSRSPPLSALAAAGRRRRRRTATGPPAGPRRRAAVGSAGTASSGVVIVSMMPAGGRLASVGAVRRSPTAPARPTRRAPRRARGTSISADVSEPWRATRRCSPVSAGSRKAVGSNGARTTSPRRSATVGDGLAAEPALVDHLLPGPHPGHVAEGVAGGGGHVVGGAGPDVQPAEPALPRQQDRRRPSRRRRAPRRDVPDLHLAVVGGDHEHGAGRAARRAGRPPAGRRPAARRRSGRRGRRRGPPGRCRRSRRRRTARRRPSRRAHLDGEARRRVPAVQHGVPEVGGGEPGGRVVGPRDDRGRRRRGPGKAGNGWKRARRQRGVRASRRAAAASAGR